MNHKCPIEGCKQKLPQNVLLCDRHWAVLPLRLQGEVHEAWNHGKPGVDYLYVREEAMERITRADRAKKEAVAPIPAESAPEQ